MFVENNEICVCVRERRDKMVSKAMILSNDGEKWKEQVVCYILLLQNSVNVKQNDL